MCGIVGVISKTPVNQLIYDALLLLQHRGQDAAGIVTAGPDANGRKFFMHKARGMVRDVFRTRNMRSLLGACGIAHTRYPTAGSAWSAAESQPFYVNSPFGIVLGHGYFLVAAAALVGFSLSVTFVVTLALPPILSPHGEIHRLAGGMFTISYSCAVIVPIICGAFWDLTGVPWTAFIPVGLCGLTLTTLGFFMSVRNTAR